jgi:hypothetical protein
MVQCIVCDRVSVSFNALIPQSHPFLIMGLGYQWSLDFTKPFPLIMWYNSCVLVMVEHFSKWIELMLSHNKSNERVAYAFLDQILNQFRAAIEVLIKAKSFWESLKHCVNKY